MDPNQEPIPARAERFATTHWSLVLAARQHGSPQSREALATLCKTYWYPLYAYARRRLHNIEEAQDLTQEFFAALLEKQSLRFVERDRGRFRSFLLTSFRNFMSKERDRAKAEKRGGGRQPLSLDFNSGERRYSLEPAHTMTPERIYERRWALTLLERVLAQLRQEFEDSGKGRLFERLKVTLTGEEHAQRYSEVARDLEMTEGAVKVAVYRLRQRYGELCVRKSPTPSPNPRKLRTNLATYSLFLVRKNLEFVCNLCTNLR